jgi:hypothetical protein
MSDSFAAVVVTATGMVERVFTLEAKTYDEAYSELSKTLMSKIIKAWNSPLKFSVELHRLRSIDDEPNVRFPYR